MQPFDVKAFQSRVRQARTPDEYQQLKRELSDRLRDLSPDEKTQLQQEFKPVWNELSNRIDELIAATEELNRRVTV